jgi:anaerobic selenocysteine-containing dehydrogenase
MLAFNRTLTRLGAEPGQEPEDDGADGLICTIDITMSDTAWYSDVVLPGDLS